MKRAQGRLGLDIRIATSQLCCRSRGGRWTQLLVAFAGMDESTVLLVVEDIWRAEADRPHGRVFGCLVLLGRVVEDPVHRRLARDTGEVGIPVAGAGNLILELGEERLPKAGHAHHRLSAGRLAYTSTCLQDVVALVPRSEDEDRRYELAQRRAPGRRRA